MWFTWHQPPIPQFLTCPYTGVKKRTNISALRNTSFVTSFSRGSSFSAGRKTTRRKRPPFEKSAPGITPCEYEIPQTAVAPRRSSKIWRPFSRFAFGRGPVFGVRELCWSVTPLNYSSRVLRFSSASIAPVEQSSPVWEVRAPFKTSYSYALERGRQIRLRRTTSVRFPPKSRLHCSMSHEGGPVRTDKGKRYRKSGYRFGSEIRDCGEPISAVLSLR